MKFIVTCLCLAFIVNALWAEDYIWVTEEDINEATIGEGKFFEGEDLYDYLDGGAELFFECGFNRLGVQKITAENIEYELRIFEMKDAESAFAALSIYKGQCIYDRFITAFECERENSFNMAAGKYFLQVSCTNCNENPLKWRIAGAAADKIRRYDIYTADFSIPSELRIIELAPYMRTLQYVKGELGLIKVMPGWLSFFHSFPRYDIFIVSADEINSKIALVVTEDEESDGFAESIGLAETKISERKTGDISHSFLKLENNKFIIVEFREDSEKLKKIISALRSSDF